MRCVTLAVKLGGGAGAVLAGDGRAPYVSCVASASSSVMWGGNSSVRKISVCRVHSRAWPLVSLCRRQTVAEVAPALLAPPRHGLHFTLGTGSLHGHLSLAALITCPIVQ